LPLDPTEAHTRPAEDLFLDAEHEPTDDSPTVISRAPPKAVGSDEVFSGSLRGRRLAHFELIEPIGVGGMAAVLRARDTQLDRPVALKILPPEMANDPEAVRRFHQEARAAARLDHENIARVFFCGEDQGLHFIAFEFVEGANLRTVLERRGRLPVAEAVHYLLQIATGLEHAALRGVVHRDIKPSNIIISPNGRAKLVDMGLARALGPSPDQSLTQSGVTLGTFDYISPEQALEPRDADVRSDIYSLGCTFYHVLTGQPPVPEGTAAKKLHHHQHIAPIDPRQLNPEIPDEVAAILARMMAKDPKDRYQTVAKLVQHLIGVAQKLGVSADVPQGPLFVEAPLPDPPRARPILLGAVAAAVLVGLVLVLSQVSGPAPPPGGGPLPTHLQARPRPQPGPSPQPPKPEHTNEGTPTQPKVELATYNYREPNNRELRDFLQAHRNQGPIKLVLHRDLDLGNARGGEGAEAVARLLFEAPEVIIEAADPQQRPAIRLKYDPGSDTGDRILAALELHSPRVTIRGVRIVVDAASALKPMAGVLLRGTQAGLIDNCELLQLNPPPEALAGQDEARLTSLVIDAPAARAVVELRHCLFASGPDSGSADTPYRGAQDAVWLKGPLQLRAVHCAFAPHTVLFRLTGGGSAPSAAGENLPQPELDLQHCSAMALGEWTAFHLEGKVPEHLRVTDCLFARLEPEAPADSPEAAERRAVLVRQNGEAPVYHGLRNRYYKLDAFLIGPAGEEHLTWESFAEAFKSSGGDREGLPLKQSPWQHGEPLRLLREQRPKDAFLVNLKLPELRQSTDPKIDLSRRLIGVEQCTWGRSYINVPPLPEEKPEPVLADKDLIVDPSAEKSGNGVYTTLTGALADIKQSGTIRIHHNGLLPIEAVRLEKAAHDITIVPDRDCHPILTLGATAEQEAFLFRVHDGKLTLKDLEFLLQPRKAGFKTQAVVEVIGEGACTLLHCAVTLDRADKKVPLAVVKLADPSQAMKMDGPGPAPAPAQVAAIGFEDCFVRGEGDLLRVSISRPFTLDARNCLLVLAGSAVYVRGNPENGKEGSFAAARLEHVTAYLGEHLVHLDAGKDLRGLVPLKVTASNCLFVARGDGGAAREGSSLLHLDGPEANEERVKALLPWDGEHNAYANFTHVFEQRSPSEERPTPPYGADRWKDLTGERKSLFLRGPRQLLPDLPANEPPPQQASKASFKVKTDGEQTAFGADIEKLPAPSPPAANPE
jgi:serine/threonine protein kinase